MNTYLYTNTGTSYFLLLFGLNFLKIDRTHPERSFAKTYKQPTKLLIKRVGLCFFKCEEAFHGKADLYLPISNRQEFPVWTYNLEKGEQLVLDLL